MRIEADDNNQSIEPNTVLKSIFDRVESVGDTLSTRKKSKYRIYQNYQIGSLRST